MPLSVPVPLSVQTLLPSYMLHATCGASVACHCQCHCQCQCRLSYQATLPTHHENYCLTMLPTGDLVEKPVTLAYTWGEAVRVDAQKSRMAFQWLAAAVSKPVMRAANKI